MGLGLFGASAGEDILPEVWPRRGGERRAAHSGGKAGWLVRPEETRQVSCPGTCCRPVPGRLCSLACLLWSPTGPQSPTGPFPLPFSEPPLCQPLPTVFIPCSPHSSLQGEYHHPTSRGRNLKLERPGDLPRPSQPLGVTSWDPHHHPSTKESLRPHPTCLPPRPLSIDADVSLESPFEKILSTYYR